MEAGSFIQTVSGRRVDPFAPRVEEIDLGDIAQALSNQCRFGGHCRRFYSVAQHACVVADAVGAEGADATAQLWGLLHDASEAYLVDLPHPLKHRSELRRLYREAEALLQDVICRRFGLPADPPPFLKRIDRDVLATERLVLMADAWEWPELEGATSLELELDPWPPTRARDEFSGRFAELDRARRS